MDSSSPFSRPAIAILIASALLLLVLSIILKAYEPSGQGPGGGKSAASSNSTSAIGYAGLYDLLKRLDKPVTRGTGNLLPLLGKYGMLIVAEPNPDSLTSEDRKIIESAPALLLVLPKWKGTPDLVNPRWVSKVELVPRSLPQQILALAVEDGDGKIVRKPWPQEWDMAEFDQAPAGSGTIQLIHSTEIAPLISTQDGILLGEIDLGRNIIWVLADPDIMSNHGLFKGDNAKLAAAMIDELRFRYSTDPNVPIIFDETLHGFRQTQGSPLKLLFRFPFVLITILTLIAAILLVLGGIRRFGAPRPEKPLLDFGKAGLISNGTRLLEHAGHQPDVLKRYIKMTLRLVANSLHAPANLNERALTAWLDKVGKECGVTESCAIIIDTINSLDEGDPNSHPHFIEHARKIHRWKEDILK